MVRLKFITLKGTRGFSLVELMIVVGIIGILAALAIPRFQQFQAKARQSEARSNLAHVYTLQVSYNGDNDTFSNYTCLSLGSGSTYSSGCGFSGGATPGTWATANTCNTNNDLGFRVTDCKKVRFIYVNTGNQNKFTATAHELWGGNTDSRRVFPGCSGNNDQWQINENKSLYNLAPGGQTALQSCN